MHKLGTDSNKSQKFTSVLWMKDSFFSEADMALGRSYMEIKTFLNELYKANISQNFW